MTSPTHENDGGIVIAMTLLVVYLATVFFGAVGLYWRATNNTTQPISAGLTRLSYLLSGWANIGNALTHVLLCIMMVGDADRYMSFFPDEAGAPVGPAVLSMINGLVGVYTIRTLSSLSGASSIPLCWNGFVALAGCLVPIVWHKFFDVGMRSWPYPVIFIWLLIYAFESVAFFFGAAGYTLSRGSMDGEVSLKKGE